MSRPVRAGLVLGVFLIFLILIGVFTTFEALTVQGVWLTFLGATSSTVAQAVPTTTNPQFSRVLVVVIALVTGWVVARGASDIRTALARALTANAIAGAMVGLFLFVMSALYAIGIDVAFVFEKLQEPTVAALLFGLPAYQGALLWVALTSFFGVLGALLQRAYARVNLRTAFAPAASQARVTSNQLRLTAIAISVAFLLIAPLFIGVYWNQVLGSIGLYVLLGLGLNIVVGFAGLLDLGYVGFYAIGAYTMALLTSPQYPVQWGFWPVLPLAMIAAALAGLILGIPVLRLRGDYLAIVTLGFGEIIRIIFKFNPYMGGSQGILNVAAPTFTIPIIGYTVSFSSSTPFFYLIFAACVIVAFIAARLNDSRTGRSWVSMREDEDAAEAMGIDTTRAKLLAFGIGALFAGLGGAIYASRQQHIFPDDFTLLISINALALIIIGGLGSIPGVIIGSIVLIGLPEVLRPIADYRLLVYAALLVIMMLVRPGGLIPSARRRREFAERDPELQTIETT